VSHTGVQQPVLSPATDGSVVRLKLFPISFFAVVMGLAGWTIAFQRAASLLGWPPLLGQVLLGLTVLAFLTIATLYFIKLVRFPQAVGEELHHPIKMSFFPTISISLLLLSIALLSLQPQVSRVLWVAGTGLHLGFTLYIMSLWINHTTFNIQHSNPAWFIPVVGNIIVPIAGVEHGMVEVSWFFFSIGIVFWIILFTIFMYRIIFHPPLAAKLVPTLFILLAPPAVGFVSYVKLMEHSGVGGAVVPFAIDPLARVLYYLALFIGLLLLAQVRMFARLQFFLSWWAYSFPVAALTIATILMFHKTDLPFFSGLATLLLVLLSGIIGLLVWRTAQAIGQREICVEE